MGGVGMGTMAIYMDDCVSGTHIAENTLWRCQTAVVLGGGRDFVVEQNVFVECLLAIGADARGIDTNPVWQNNIKGLRESLKAMRYDEPPYSERYPEIARVDPHYAAGKGVPPEHNRVERNICWHSPLDRRALAGRGGQRHHREGQPSRHRSGIRGRGPSGC